MTLNSSQIELLGKAIRAYDYPAVTYDFVNEEEVAHPGMPSVEKSIRDQLLSTDPNVVKDGLSNVLYWGYARAGYGNYRVELFRKSVTGTHLSKCMDLFGDLALLEPGSIGGLTIRTLPQFGLAFSTKLLAFLDPERFVVLDAQLGRLSDEAPETFFGRIRTVGSYGTIELNVYRDWCRFCVNVAHTYWERGARAVDVERGIYHMVTHEGLREAAEIVRAAE